MKRNLNTQFHTTWEGSFGGSLYRQTAAQKKSLARIYYQVAWLLPSPTSLTFWRGILSTEWPLTPFLTSDLHFGRGWKREIGMGRRRPPLPFHLLSLIFVEMGNFDEAANERTNGGGRRGGIGRGRSSL